MAIIRPARGGGPKKKVVEAVKIAEVIDTKKKQIEKKQVVKTTSKEKLQVVEKAKKAATPKKKAAKKKQPSKPKLLTPPKDLKTEEQWIKYLSGVSIAQVSEYLAAKPDSIDMPMGLAIRSIANKLVRVVSAVPSDHNEWLDFFSTMTREETEEYMDSHRMDNEAKAAGMRWLAIAENPSLIDKIVNSRLENKKAEQLGDIVEAAKSKDEIKMFEAIRDKIAYQIQDGSGARDMTVLIKQLRETAGILAELYRAAGMNSEQETSNIRKILLSARQRSRRPKQQAIQKISDIEAGEDVGE